MNPFDFINSLSKETKIKYTEEAIENYFSPFLAFQFFGNFSDTISEANYINTFRSPLSKYETYIMLNYLIDKRNRFSKKEKVEKEKEENIKVIMEHYKYSREKAKEVLNLHTEEMIDKMKNKNIGGKIK